MTRRNALKELDNLTIDYRDRTEQEILNLDTAVDMAVTALKGGWITDRNPIAEETREAGDTGFILCISGKRSHAEYDHAITMDGNFYEEGEWSINDLPQGELVIHGWMMLPSWE